jgi:hypothetical protein
MLEGIGSLDEENGILRRLRARSPRRGFGSYSTDPQGSPPVQAARATGSTHPVGRHCALPEQVALNAVRLVVLVQRREPDPARGIS